MFRSWTHLISEINKTRGPRLEALPKTPGSDEFKLQGQWIAELIYTCDNILWALSEEGVTNELDSVITAIEVGKSVPEDIGQAATDLWNAWWVMFTKLRPMAVNYITRLDEVMELDEGVDEKVAEWTEKFERVEEAKRFFSTMTEHWTRLLQGDSEGLENQPTQQDRPTQR
jgi:hypothetical protein